ncbi:MAG: tRNA (adenosine(37)-N6)-threonylcarbamoyltransferase complex dimerization subunit type 1 TsaB [Acidobacteria bacterium 13_1_20CM_3_53_8]|nr:MAG: tRNA (adenosine(37)-N6)-threonylcarbamoyltransferase complex dimerization subunit type 1 TsaB [Acidobacteria bacterium 13_1_20CM_3_53_8]
MKETLQLGEVDLFAVTLGPGSFTGLRIGLATVKSFSATLSRPCVGIPSLEAVAYDAATPSSLKILAALPAGRGELFSQLFSISAEGLPQPLEEPTHLSPQCLLEKVKNLKPLVWAGDGARAFSRMIEEFALREGVKFAGEAEISGRSSADWVIASQVDPLAVSLASLAWRRYLQGKICYAAELKAIYVRPSDAEIKRA